MPASTLVWVYAYAIGLIVLCVLVILFMLIFISKNTDGWPMQKRTKPRRRNRNP